MPSDALVLVVPMPPTLTNSGRGRSRHWRALEREKHAYWLTLSSIALSCRLMRFPGHPWLIPEWPASPMLRVTIASHMTLRGAMDDDNAAARHKWVIDWLVGNGYLASDRRTCVRWAAFPTQHVTRTEPPRIELTITPRPDGGLDPVRLAEAGR